MPSAPMSVGPVRSSAGATERSPAAARTTTSATTTTTALPVRLTVEGRHADGVRRWVEGTLGWQPVDADPDGPVPPALHLCDVDGLGAAGAADALPVVLLVDDDAAPAAVARAVSRGVPVEVVGWPSGRDELADAAARALTRRTGPTRGIRTVRVGGAAGGVGTSTVALCLAGLRGWQGDTVLVAVRGRGLPHRVVDTASLAGADLWRQADEVPGCPPVRALRLVDAGPVPEVRDPAVGTAVLDLGVDPDADVLVCRPDAAGLAALDVTAAAAVVVVGAGPAPPVDVRRRAGGRRVVHLPWSVRVARAGMAGRVPASVPGAFLRRLAPLTADPRPVRRSRR